MNICRRQCKVHQIEMDIKKKGEQIQTLRYLQAWWSVIQRKHASKNFHEGHLVRRTFNYWNTRARRQLHSKQLEQMEQVLRLVLEYVFMTRWCAVEHLNNRSISILARLFSFFFKHLFYSYHNTSYILFISVLLAPMFTFMLGCY